MSKVEIDLSTFTDMVSDISATKTMVQGLTERLDKALPFLQDEHAELTKRVSVLENKSSTQLGWASGIGSAVGSMITAIGFYFKFFKH